MPRRGQRKRIDTGIFRDGAGYSVIAYGKEVRMPLGSSKGALLRRRAALIDALAASDDSLTAAPGTLRKDLPRYMELAQHLSERGRVQKVHLRAWLPHLGDVPRRAVTRHDILRIRGIWLGDTVAPKTCNNRLTALRSLYRLLDGDDAPSPCDRIKPLPVHRTPAVAVPAADILAVDRKLQENEQRTRGGHLRDAKTRARFRVRASTGRRPSEIMRTQPTDVDLARRVWTPRDGKGGFTPGIYLTDDMVAAWKLFITAEAWGPFSTRLMARVLRSCGWHPQIRPYQLRHSVGIALSEAGVDLADVQQMMGHKNQATTRRHYVPVINARLQRAAETIEGRLKWETVPRAGSTSNMEPRGNTNKKRESNGVAHARSTGRKRDKSSPKRGETGK